MKYSFETTEAETLAMIGVMDRIVTQMMAILHAKVSGHTVGATAPVAPEPAEPALKQEVKFTAPPKAAPAKKEEAHPYADMDFSAYYDIPEEYKNIKPPVWHPDTHGDGMRLFDELTSLWKHNLGVEGAEQPDRATIMREYANHPKVLVLLGHVAEVGGLTHAVAQHVNHHRLADFPEFSEDEKALVNLIATNMCQVASILFPDLAQMYEHRDIFKERK